MKNCIVTTTIFKPSLALKKFSELKDWTLIVVGDLKTPQHLYKKLNNVIYLSPLDQEKISKKLSNLIGWNCIQRRNFGYIFAKYNGAKVVASVDDDNIPYSDWGKKIFLNKKINVNYFNIRDEVFDPLSIFKFKEKIWHRGYPINLLQKRAKAVKNSKIIKADIQANLWDVCPDIDAINRISLKKEDNFYFPKVTPYSSNKYSPFNSQNTIFTIDVLKNYFLFPFVGRMDDIWASYYVQSLGFKVVFCDATVFQKRNQHVYYNDFKNELIGYVNNFDLVKSLYHNPSNIKNFLPKRSYLAFKEYQKIMKTI
jgi:hypothetical protein